MNPREQREIELAEKANIRQVGKGVESKWIVPWATDNTKYIVEVNGDKQHCTCIDHELRRCKCKHIFAVEYVISNEVHTEVNQEGQTIVTETVTATKRTTYAQNWPAYNTAQTVEKEQFQVLLHGLCKHLPEPPRIVGKSPGGRKPVPYSDAIFSAAFKVYSTVSGRRFISDLKDAHAKGYISRCIHYNSIFNCLETEDVTPILKDLIRNSSEPLRGVECGFAVDSSGFSGSKFEKWSYVKYNSDRKDLQEHQGVTDWIKMHLMCGVKTNIVTSVEISERYDHDSPYFAPLVNDTAKRFSLKEASADKAYSSRDNLNATAAHGAIPMIPFRSNSNGGALAIGEKLNEGRSDLWLNMWRFYTFHTDQFMEHYHKRSNVESTFAMIKGKFGNGLRSKGRTAQINEALCKVLCHNICCVIQSIHELGIEVEFGRKMQ